MCVDDGEPLFWDTRHFGGTSATVRLLRVPGPFTVAIGLGRGLRGAGMSPWHPKDYTRSPFGTCRHLRQAPPQR